LLVEDIAAISAMVLAICEGKGRSTAHAYITVGPLWRCAAIHHTACDLRLRRKQESFSLQTLVDLVDV